MEKENLITSDEINDIMNWAKKYGVTFLNNETVRRLYLVKNPTKIFAASRLSVWLWNKNMPFMPQSIGCLRSLRSISFTGNKLLSLPDSMGDLHDLVELRLTNNQLVTFPEVICRLEKLKTLFLEANGLTSVPVAIERLQKQNNWFLQILWRGK